MNGRLIALEKHPGVRTVGVLETWRRIFAKCVMRITGLESTSTCQDDNLCAGLTSGIYGTVLRVQTIWDTKSATWYWVFLIVHFEKAFNEINQIGILWKFWHLCPSGARFVFNFYRHWSYLVLRKRMRQPVFCTIGRAWRRGTHYLRSYMV